MTVTVATGTGVAFVTLEALTCSVCGIAYAIDQTFVTSRRRDHVRWYCPNGHGQAFHGETPDRQRIRQLEQQVIAERAATERATDARKWAEQRARGANIAAGLARGQLRRALARAHAGVCPHCHRTFKQLAAHMRVKHPIA